MVSYVPGAKRDNTQTLKQSRSGTACNIADQHWIRLGSSHSGYPASSNASGRVLCGSTLVAPYRGFPGAEVHIPALSALHCPGIENCETNVSVVSSWALHPEVFKVGDGTKDVELLKSRFNTKLERFVSRTGDPRMFVVDALW